MPPDPNPPSSERSAADRIAQLEARLARIEARLGLAEEPAPEMPTAMPDVTPPLAMTADAVPAYAELGVDRLLVNLGSQRPERVGPRLGEIETMVKKAA